MEKIKTINNKMATNLQLSTSELKKPPKPSQQPEQKQNHRNGDHMEGYQLGGGGRDVGKSTGNK